MFKEIAIEPAAVATSYRDFSYIIEKFGISEGRLIAAFPSKWKRIVYQAAQANLRGTAELSKLEVRLHSLPKEIFYARGRSGDGCLEDWLGAAFSEHQREPFDTIIVREKRADPFTVAAADLDGQHPCMQPNRQWHVYREASVMALCCAPILSSAKHIKFIDPYFDAGELRFRRPMLEFLKHIQSNSRVDIFRGDKMDSDFVVKRIEQHVRDAMPKGAELRLFLFPQDLLHNRYVLTESGGLYFSTGLDDKGSGRLVTDEVGLLDPAVWDALWKRYAGDNPVAAWKQL